MNDAIRKRPRLCFIAHNAYGPLTGIETGHNGGLERLQAMLAKGLSLAGFDVSFICWGRDEPRQEKAGDIEIRYLAKQDAGIPGLRFLPRWLDLIRTLREADADCYVYACGDSGLGQIVLWARRQHRKVLYVVVSDADCQASLPALKPLRERLLYRFGIRHCDRIVAQTRRQQALLRSEFGLDAVVIRSPSEGFDVVDRASGSRQGERPRVLWIGRFSPEKRPDWLIPMAQRLVDVEFDVLGGANAASDYADRFLEQAATIDNIHLHGRVPHDEIGRFLERASALCCTSEVEGMPNVFLEAWSTGLPVVSTCDPDGILTEFGIGLTATTIEGLCQSLEKMLGSRAAYLEMSARSRAYFREYHAIDRVIPRFSDEIIAMMRAGDVPS